MRSNKAAILLVFVAVYFVVIPTVLVFLSNVLLDGVSEGFSYDLETMVAFSMVMWLVIFRKALFGVSDGRKQ